MMILADYKQISEIFVPRMDLIDFSGINQSQNINILIYNLDTGYYERGRSHERSNPLLL